MANQRKHILTIDDEFKLINPPLSVFEEKQLTDSIRKNGCFSKIVAWRENGIILDGHYRYHICKQFNIAFSIKYLRFQSRSHAKEWMIRNQFSRRNLKPYHHCKLASKLNSIHLSIAGDKPSSDHNTIVEESKEIIEADTGVSLSSIEVIRKIKKLADIKFIDNLQTVDLYIKSIERELASQRRNRRRDEKRKLINTIIEERHELAKMIEDAVNFGWYQGSWQDHISKLRDKSVTLLLTDPPYGANYINNSSLIKRKRIQSDDDCDSATLVFRDMLQQLNRKLCDNAHILCFINWKNEPSFRKVFENFGFQLRGSLVWVKNSHTLGNYSKSFASKHERIIHAVKGDPYQSEFNVDVIDAKLQTSYEHPTPKPISLLKRLIQATTVEGELVADPFGGIASIPVAAQLVNRRSWGTEIDLAYYLSGLARLYEAQNLNLNIPKQTGA